MKVMKNRKGLSPVVATVLLILVVVIIAMIIFLWFKSIAQESITKFEEDVKVICQRDVSFDFSYSDGKLLLRNQASVPIYDFAVQRFTQDTGETATVQLRDEQIDFKGLSGGASEEVVFDSAGASELTLVPVILGNRASGGTAPHTCDANSGVTAAVA